MNIFKRLFLVALCASTVSMQAMQNIDRNTVEKSVYAVSAVACGLNAIVCASRAGEFAQNAPAHGSVYHSVRASNALIQSVAVSTVAAAIFAYAAYTK